MNSSMLVQQANIEIDVVVDTDIRANNPAPEVYVSLCLMALC